MNRIHGVWGLEGWWKAEGFRLLSELNGQLHWDVFWFQSAS